MKQSPISKIETFRLPPRWLFVRVETSDGFVGWGEATLEGHTEAVEGAFEDLKTRFMNCNADNIQDIWQTAYTARFYRGGPVLMSALSGLDIALWDIKGKKLGVPVWQLLGGKVRDKVRVYGWIGGDKPRDVIAAAVERKKEGFDAVKMNATEDLAWIDSPDVLTAAAYRVHEVRALGLDVGVDFHGRLHKGMAKQMAKLLEPHRPLFIEEPMLPTQPEEIADLAKQITTPIALGERLYTRSDFRPYLERRAIDIAQPDVSHCGGISELHKIASLTETYDVALAPHCPTGPIALAACMQIDISAPNFFIQEMSWKIHYNVSPEPGKEADLYTYLLNPEIFKVKDGHVAALQGPGIGVEINEELVRKTSENYIQNLPAWRNPVWRGEDGSLRECNIRRALDPQASPIRVAHRYMLPPPLLNEVCTIIEAVLYGLYLATTFLCLRRLLYGRHEWKPARLINWPMLAVTVTIFVTSTVDMALSIRRSLLQILGASPDMLLWSNRTMSVLVASQALLADAVLLYRCWIVFSKSKIILVLPVVLWSVDVACAVTYASWQPAERQRPSLAKDLVMTFWGCSIITNIYATSLIVYKMMRIARVKSQPTLRLTFAMRIIVESGMLYTATAVAVLFGGISLPENADPIMIASAINFQTVGIASNLILIRITPTAVERESPDTEVLTTVRLTTFGDTSTGYMSKCDADGTDCGFSSSSAGTRVDV